MKLTRKHKVIDGLKVSYLEEIDNDSPPLLFIHGWNSEAKVNEYLFNLFGPKFHVIIPDLPGFGKSDPLKKYTVEKYAQKLARLIKELGYEKVSLAGHSMGGCMCVELALQNPELINKIMLINPAIFEDKYIRKPLKVVKEFAMTPGNDHKAHLLLTSDAYAKIAGKLPLSLKNLVPRPGVSEKTYKDTLLMLMKYDFVTRFNKVKVPVKVVYGSRDLIWTNLTKRTKSRFKEISTRLKGSHNLDLIDAKELTREINSFFD